MWGDVVLSWFGEDLLGDELIGYIGLIESNLDIIVEHEWTLLCKGGDLLFVAEFITGNKWVWCCSFDRREGWEVDIVEREVFVIVGECIWGICEYKVV